jgi:hypothetical protein
MSLSSRPSQRRLSQRSWVATTTAPGAESKASSNSSARASEVVRGLVQEQDVRRAGDEDRQGEPAALASA